MSTENLKSNRHFLTCNCCSDGSVSSGVEAVDAGGT